MVLISVTRTPSSFLTFECHTQVHELHGTHECAYFHPGQFTRRTRAVQKIPQLDQSRNTPMNWILHSRITSVPRLHTKFLPHALALNFSLILPNHKIPRAAAPILHSHSPLHTPRIVHLSLTKKTLKKKKKEKQKIFTTYAKKRRKHKERITSPSQQQPW